MTKPRPWHDEDAKPRRWFWGFGGPFAWRRVSQTPKWVWLKVKQLGLRGFGSTCPFTRFHFEPHPSLHLHVSLWFGAQIQAGPATFDGGQLGNHVCTRMCVVSALPGMNSSLHSLIQLADFGDPSEEVVNWLLERIVSYLDFARRSLFFFSIACKTASSHMSHCSPILMRRILETLVMQQCFREALQAVGLGFSRSQVDQQQGALLCSFFSVSLQHGLNLPFPFCPCPFPFPFPPPYIVAFPVPCHRPGPAWRAVARRRACGLQHPGRLSVGRWLSGPYPCKRRT